MEKPGVSLGSQRVIHDLVTEQEQLHKKSVIQSVIQSTFG